MFFCADAMGWTVGATVGSHPTAVLLFQCFVFWDTLSCVVRDMGAIAP